jgi:hypothetical protein
MILSPSLPNYHGAGTAGAIIHYISVYLAYLTGSQGKPSRRAVRYCGRSLIQQGFSRVRPDVGREAFVAPREIKPIRHFTHLAYGEGRRGWTYNDGRKGRMSADLDQYSLKSVAARMRRCRITPAPWSVAAQPPGEVERKQGPGTVSSRSAEVDRHPQALRDLMTARPWRSPANKRTS